MKKVIFVFFCVILFLVGCNSSGYGTLEKAVQSQWDSPIKVINQDEEKQLVYYVYQTLHVIGTYEYRNGKFFYDGEQSRGIQFGSEQGLPFYIEYQHFEGLGDIVYGAIFTKNHEVDQFIIHYENGEVQEIKAKNNTFILEIPANVKTEDFLSEISEAYGYDRQGNVIKSWK